MAKKVDKSSFNNTWYKPGAGIIIRSIWYFINVIFFINYFFPFYGLKRFLLKIFGAKIGKRLVIKPGVNIKYPWKLKCGDYVSIGERTWIDNLEFVYLGDHTTISQGAMLITGNHNFKKSTFDLMVKPIIIEEGAWIGSGSIVCPGVICKSHSILVVGSVATHDLESYTIYQGNPASKIRKREIE